MVENTWIILNTAVSSAWKYVCGCICYFLYKIIELKLHINVKYDDKECKYCNSFELLCVKIIFLFLNIFITGGTLHLSVSSFHHELFYLLKPIWNFSFGAVRELRNIGPIRLIILYMPVYWAICSLLYAHFWGPVEQTDVSSKSLGVCDF
jgi:hypothetical protein